jgi:MtaA/CmuA family methyltransferase
MLIAPDNAKKAIARGAEFSGKIVEAQLEKIDADYVVYTDPVSSADMIDDSMFREFNLGPLRKNITSWKGKYGIDTMLHICGDTTPMLEDFVDTGARVMSMDHAVNLAEAKKAFRGRMVIMGNLDPVSVLMRGSVSDVEKAAEKCFMDAGQDGGYIFGAGCAVPSGTPMENILKISEVSKRHPY